MPRGWEGNLGRSGVALAMRHGLKWLIHLRQGGNVFAGVCLFMCQKDKQKKVMDGSFWNFVGMSGIANTTSDSVLRVIRKESWILDHFEIYIDFNGP